MEERHARDILLLKKLQFLETFVFRYCSPLVLENSEREGLGSLKHFSINILGQGEKKDHMVLGNF